MSDKKEKPISVRLSTKALARLNRLTAELDMNRTSVIQEALKALEREHEAQKAAAPHDTSRDANHDTNHGSAQQNGNGTATEGEPRATLPSGA
jgi:predicted transcriptional regulator